MIRLDGYVHALNSLRDELFDLHHTQGLSWREIANMERFQGISHIMLWRIDQGYDPKGKTREMLGLPPIRVRLAADVTEEQKDALQTWAKYHFGGWTELCREMAECLLAEDGSVSMTFSWHKHHIFDGGDDEMS